MLKRGEAVSMSRDALCGAGFVYAPWPAMALDAEGRLIVANEAAEVLFGQSLSALSRRPLTKVLPAQSLLRSLFLRARREQLPVRQAGVPLELGAEPNGRAEAAIVPLPTGEFLVSLYVESQSARLERTSESLRSVAGMGRTLAHEIKNPLAGIRGAAQLLKLGASVEDAPLAQVIVEETERIRRLVDQVEAFSDERVAERRAVNIHQVLDRVRTLLASAFAGEVAFADAYDPSLPSAYGDEDQLVQIFLNIAKNAAEAALERRDGRGEVLIATGYRSGARVRARGDAWRSTPLEVRVQDNGPGVPPDLRHRLFDAFVTSKPQGMGLGLTLVAKLVEAHTGLVELDSEPGRTVVRVLLPVVSDPPSALES